MTRFSVCMPYHNNPQMLDAQYALWASLPRYVLEQVEFLICDDASESVVPEPEDTALPVRLFRIDPPHIAWSHRCATNIAAHHAAGHYIIVTDIDHMIDAQAWSQLFCIDFFQSHRVYTFQRKNYFDGADYKPHPDSWLMHRDMWNALRGYDERYRGYYGQNAPFIERVKCHAKTEQLGVKLTRVSRDDILDASERVLTRKSDHARRMIASKRQEFKTDGTFLDDTRLSVPFREVYP